MTINSVSNTSAATSYQKTNNNQEVKQGQRMQRKDGSGQGKKLHKAEMQSKTIDVSGNQSMGSGSRTDAIGSNFDMKV